MVFKAMKPISRDEVIALTDCHADPAVSIYMPNYPSRTEKQHNRLTLKALLRSVEEQLSTGGLPKAEIEKLLQPAFGLLEGEPIWQQGSNGLALLLAESAFHTFWLPNPVPELALVGQHFHAKPMLPLLRGNTDFYVLALSQNAVKLWAGTPLEFHEIALPYIPTSVKEALHELPEKQTLSRASGISGEAALFYSLGARTDVKKDELLHFFRAVDQGLGHIFKGDQVPLVLAAVDYLIPIYRQANSYIHLMDAYISGNPETTSAASLQERAWQIVERIEQRKEKAALVDYEALKQTEQASAKLLKIVNAAYHGRVDTLFVAMDRQRWGKFDPTTGRLCTHAEAEYGDDDILDRTAAQALKHGGSVYARDVKEMPDQALAVATFRY